MSEVAEKTAEVVAENVEEAVDGVVETLEVVRTNPKLVILAGLVGVAAGSAGGYFVAKKQLKAFYEDLASQEIAEARAFYAQVNKVGEDGEVLTPQDVMEQRHGVEAAASALREYRGNGPYETEEDLIAAAKDEQGHPSDVAMDEAQIQKIERELGEARDTTADTERVVVEEVVETRNVFQDPQFDLDHERRLRTQEKPYIITHDEYFAAEKDYETVTLTYFEVDGVLLGEDEQTIDNSDEIVGEATLTRFGHGSKDNNMVYVRNDKLATDYEIVRSKGSYLEEVLGLPDEPNSLRHSDQRDRRRAFRHGDG